MPLDWIESHPIELDSIESQIELEWTGLSPLDVILSWSSLREFVAEPPDTGSCELDCGWDSSLSRRSPS